MKQINGLYLDLASVPALTEQPAWTITRIDVYADIRPTLDISRAGSVDSFLSSGAEIAKARRGVMTAGVPRATDMGPPSPAEVASGLLLSVHGYPTEPMTLQRSLDLAQWDGILVMRDGESYAEPITSEQQFYRLSH
jgi:hypothetical protein